MLEEAMRAYYAAYNAEDAERLATLLDEDVELVSAMGTRRGREAYLATYRYMIGLFVDRMEPVEIAVEGDVATVRIVDRLTARADVDDFMGQAVKAGETIVLELVGRYKFREGRIARIAISAA